MTFVLLMPAAGSGSRLGAATPKSLIDLAGEPLFVHAIRAFISHPLCREALVAVPAEHLLRYTYLAGRFLPGHSIRFVAGGATRQQSVQLALLAAMTKCDCVLVHDAARPFVSRELIDTVLAAWQPDIAAVVPGVRVTDTLKRATGDPLEVRATVPRDQLFAVQTPQLLRMDVARRVHALAVEHDFTGTDDVSLVERFDLGPVRLVQGDSGNIKITTRGDLDSALAMLDTFRIRTTVR